MTAHTAFTHHDLIEGNWTPNLGGDTTHGNSGWHTHFRNFASGINSTRVVTQNLRAVGMDGWTHFHAYVGNVLARRERVRDEPLQWQLRRHAHLSIGQVARQLRIPRAGTTAIRLDHVYRDGNWDNVSNTASSGLALRVTLPPSLYLRASPASSGPSRGPGSIRRPQPRANA